MSDHRFFNSTEQAARYATRWRYIQLEDEALESPSPLGQAFYNILQEHPGKTFSPEELIEELRNAPDTYVADPAHLEAVTAYLDTDGEVTDRHPRNDIGLTLMNLKVMDNRVTPGSRPDSSGGPSTPDHECVWMFDDRKQQ